MKKTLINFSFIFFLLSAFAIALLSCEKDDLIENPDCGCMPDTLNACDTCVVAYKPNIYLYPEEAVQLNVNLSFPKGGKIIVSEPVYNNGWKVSIDPKGTIDNEYSFLFYESQQPDIWQKEKGWVVHQSDLETFFRQNMTAYGFQGQEIEDFVDFWVPELSENNYYVIYPQTKELIEEVIELEISQHPENVLRLFYYIATSEQQPNAIPEPSSPSVFLREGFTVAEWGVLMK